MKTKHQKIKRMEIDSASQKDQSKQDIVAGLRNGDTTAMEVEQGKDVVSSSTTINSKNESEDENKDQAVDFTASADNTNNNNTGSISEKSKVDKKKKNKNGLVSSSTSVSSSSEGETSSTAAATTTTANASSETSTQSSIDLAISLKKTLDKAIESIQIIKPISNDVSSSTEPSEIDTTTTETAAAIVTSASTAETENESSLNEKGKSKSQGHEWFEDSFAMQDLIRHEKQVSEIKSSGLRDLNQAMKEFQKLSKNCYLSGTIRKPKISEEDIPICDCDGKERKCGASDICHNRVIQMECDPKLCPAGVKCENCRFQKGKFPKVIVRSTGDRGCGLFAGEDIQKGDLVQEYRGEVISDEEMQRRLKQEYKGQRHQYMMVLSGDNGIIDATQKGAVARFMNHCCEPNCYVQEWNVLGFPRMGIFALKNIAKDEELSFDYKMKRLGSMFENCKCGAPSCRGSLSIEEPGAMSSNGADSAQDRETISRLSNTGTEHDGKKRGRSENDAGGKKSKRKIADNEEGDPVTGAMIKVEMDLKMCAEINANFFKKEILNPPMSMKLGEEGKKEVQRARTFLIRNVIAFRNANTNLLLS